MNGEARKKKNVSKKENIYEKPQLKKVKLADLNKEIGTAAASATACLGCCLCGCS